MFERPTLSLVSCLVLSLASGCFLSSPTRPLRVVADVSEEPTDCLFVFLPGFADEADAFARHGLVETAREAGCDSLSTGAHFGFYRTFTIIDRLRGDVIGPARERGYERVWLTGISMGGFGALSYAEAYPDDVDGVILLAPFLGDTDVLDEISQHRLAELGEPIPREGRDGESQTRAIWTWVKAQLGERGTPVFLGYGVEDGGADQLQLLERELPADHVVKLPGGHSWDAWSPAFRRLAPRALGERVLAAAPPRTF